MRLSVLALWLLAGCGARGAAALDGGPPDSSSTDTAPATPRSFEIQAMLGAAADGGNIGPVPSLPPSASFTLVLDPQGGRIIAGANGAASVVPVTTTDGKTFEATKPLVVRTASVGVCAGANAINYQSLELTVMGDALTGKGAGKADISCGDCQFSVPFQAALQGTVDTTPPGLVAQVGASGALDPFAPLTFLASEPMPATVTARLVASSGAAIDLKPFVQEGDVPLVTGFSKPDVVLRAGEGYAVTLDGLVDFAGHVGPRDVVLRLSATAAAPLVAEDGFESATGTSLGGAAVVKGQSALAGTQSLYIGSGQAPTLGAVSAGGSLLVRLALQPGDTRLRFSSRSLSMFKDFGFAGTVSIGSPGRGGAVTGGVNVSQISTETVSPLGNVVYTSDAATTEIALPADASDEVIVQLMPSAFDCGPALPSGGLLIDDLRAE